MFFYEAIEMNVRGTSEQMTKPSAPLVEKLEAENVNSSEETLRIKHQSLNNAEAEQTLEVKMLQEKVVEDWIDEERP